MPVANLLDVVKWCDDTTQTVGIYPESLRDELLDSFALAGVQRMVPLSGGDPMQLFMDMHTLAARDAARRDRAAAPQRPLGHRPAPGPGSDPTQHRGRVSRASRTVTEGAVKSTCAGALAAEFIKSDPLKAAIG